MVCKSARYLVPGIPQEERACRRRRSRFSANMASVSMVMGMSGSGGFFDRYGFDVDSGGEEGLLRLSF